MTRVRSMKMVVSPGSLEELAKYGSKITFKRRKISQWNSKIVVVFGPPNQRRTVNPLGRVVKKECYRRKMLSKFIECILRRFQISARNVKRYQCQLKFHNDNECLGYIDVENSTKKINFINVAVNFFLSFFR